MPLAGPEGAGAIAIERAWNAGLTFQAAMETAGVLPDLPYVVYVPIGGMAVAAIVALWLRTVVLSDRLDKNHDRLYDISSRVVSTLDANTVTAREGHKLLEELHEVLVQTTPAKRERRA